jgi:hypothetical protein
MRSTGSPLTPAVERIENLQSVRVLWRPSLNPGLTQRADVRVQIAALKRANDVFF